MAGPTATVLNTVVGATEIRVKCGDVREFRYCDLDEAKREARGDGDAKDSSVSQAVHEMKDCNSECPP
jgi:hypothetical protein